MNLRAKLLAERHADIRGQEGGASEPTDPGVRLPSEGESFGEAHLTMAVQRFRAKLHRMHV